MNKQSSTRLIAAIFVATAFVSSGAMSQTLNEDIVLRIDVSTGAASIENAGEAAMNIDAYEISSTLGFLNPAGWASIAPAGGWVEPAGGTINSIAELNPSGTPLFLEATTGTQAIGSPFAAGDNAVFDAAITTAGFGNNYLDVEFLFGDDDANDQFRGSVVYENPRFNNLVLEINTSSGAATLINESTLDVTIDVLEFTSAAGALNTIGFDGIRDTQLGWETSSQNSVNGLVEFLPGNGSPAVGETIAGGASFTLGNAFAAGNPSRDVEFLFHILGGSDDGFVGAVRYIGTLSPLFGDADNDFAVAGSDLLAVTNNFGSTGPADGLLLGDADDDGAVAGSDLLAVTNNFGSTAGASGLTSGVTVPEPSTVVLGLLGCLGFAAAKRREMGKLIVVR